MCPDCARAEAEVERLQKELACHDCREFREMKNAEIARLTRESESRKWMLLKMADQAAALDKESDDR